VQLLCFCEGSSIIPSKMTKEDNSNLKLNQHLNSLLKFDVDTVFNIIYNTLVKWVHQTYKDVPEYEIAYDKFIKLTRAAISLNQYDRYPNKTNLPEIFLQYRTVKDANDEIDYLLSSLNQMSTKTGITFLSELTAAWCLACPRETVKHYIDNESVSDIDLANTLFSWLLRPFDYFS